jgi:hypothetical protein
MSDKGASIQKNYQAMTRRGFLGALLAGAVLDPERALWRPGAKLISIPSPPSLSVRVLRVYDIERDQWLARVDVLPGFGLEMPLGVDVIVRRGLSQKNAVELIERAQPGIPRGALRELVCAAGPRHVVVGSPYVEAGPWAEMTTLRRLDRELAP